MSVIPGLGFLCVVAGVVLIVFLRHRRRMAMIEKGIMPVQKPREALLRRGLILAFLGGGILVSFAILRGVLPPSKEISMLVGVILLAIGIAELIYYRLTKPKPVVPKPPLGHLRRGIILSFVGGGILVFFSISIPTGFTGANEPIQIIIFVGVILLTIGIAELIYYRLTKHKTPPPAEKEENKAPGTGKD